MELVSTKIYYAGLAVCIAFASFFGTASIRAQETGSAYRYDSVWNRLDAAGLIRQNDARMFTFQPTTALHGERVNILGRNLPESGIIVTFNGVTATIASVAPTVMTVEVPAGAMTGPLVVTLPDGTQVNFGEFRVQGIVVTPDEAMIVVEQNLCFEAALTGLEDQLVSWEVLCPLGSEQRTDCGQITAIVDVDGTQKGCYSPPSRCESNASAEAIIKASVGNVTVYARVTIFGTVGDPGPLTALLVGQTDSGLMGNTTVALPPIVTTLAASVDLVTMGTTVAFPIVSVILPAAVGPGFPASVTVALPPILAFLFGEQPGESPPNTTVAKPPVTVEFEPAPTLESEEPP